MTNETQNKYKDKLKLILDVCIIYIVDFVTDVGDLHSVFKCTAARTQA